MKNWRSIAANREHLEAIASLARSHYGDSDDTAQAEYLLHEYFENPDGDAIVQIAWNDDKQEAGGQEALVPKQVKLGSRTVMDLMSVNTITRADYQGQGVFTTLGRDALRSAEEAGCYEISHGMPNQNSYHGFVTKLGYTDLGSLPLYVRPLRPSHLVRDFLHQNWLAPFAKPVDWLTAYRHAPAIPEGASFVKLSTENLSLADAFWERIKDKYPIMVQRTGSYLRYRFVEIPRRNYTCWYALRDGAPVAFVIGRVMEVSGMQCAMIADFLFVTGFEQEAWALLRHVLFLLQCQGGNLAGCLMQPFTEEAKILKKTGFFVCPKGLEPQPFPFILRILGEDPALQMAMDFRNWFFTMGDYDVV